MSAVRLALLTVGTGALLYLAVPPSQDIAPSDPNRDDKARLLVLQRMKRIADANNPGKPLDIQKGDSS
ncbi:Hypothetical protein NTJ_15127 [Nesidiocoris tenuis]|nr:Hypothetical protein NTJ_15127 [Nesidiocoris tenuis]